MGSNLRSPKYPSNYRCMIDSKAACRKPSPYSLGLAGPASDATSHSVQCPCSTFNDELQPQMAAYNAVPSTVDQGGRFPVRMQYNYIDTSAPPPFMESAAIPNTSKCHKEIQAPTTTPTRYCRPQNLMGRPRTLASERSAPYSQKSIKCPCVSSANEDEFFSLSSASSEKDNDESLYRSAEGFSSKINSNIVCGLRPPHQGQSQPQARNMVILQLLHEVVHLINEDEKTSERNIREGNISAPVEKQRASDCDCGASEAEEMGQYSSSIKITFTPSHKSSQPCDEEPEGQQQQYQQQYQQQQQWQQQMPCMPCGVFITPNMQCPACMMHAMQPQLQLLHQGGPLMNLPSGAENTNYAMEADPNLIIRDPEFIEEAFEVKPNYTEETDPFEMKPIDFEAHTDIKPDFIQDTPANINNPEANVFAQCICQPGEHNASCPMHGFNADNPQNRAEFAQCICQPGEHDASCPIHGRNAGSPQMRERDIQCICQPGDRNASCPMHGVGAEKLQNGDVDLDCICGPDERNESCPMHGGFNKGKQEIRVRSDIYANGDDRNKNFSENEYTRTDTHDSSSELDIECEENEEDCLFEKARRKAARSAKKSKDGKKCDCCHCRAIREQQNNCLTIATPEQALDGGKGGNGYSEMKFFIDSIVMDLEAMDHARRLKQNQQSICPTIKKPNCPRQSFPVTIMDVTDLGSTSLYIKWCIHDCFGIGGYEIYVDGYLTNRYFHCKHEAAVICDVDVTIAHKIVLVATPLVEDKFDEMCGDKTNKSKSLVRKGKEKGPPPSAVWTPSIYLYDPANKRDGPPIIKCSC